MNENGLCRLLQASLDQWGISASCRGNDDDLGDAAAPDDAAMTVRMDLTGAQGNPQHATLSRVHDEGVRLPVWRLQIDGRRPVEAVSIRQALKALRMELDRDFRPGRAIIGQRPAAPASSPGEQAR